MSANISFPGATLERGLSQGYLALPPDSALGPGVVVIQEWWGLVPQVERVCERLAAEGYLALAPDLYHGSSASYTEPDQAAKLRMELDMPHALDEITAAAEFLRAHPSAEPRRVGSIGFCMGGGLSLMAAAANGLEAAVTFYGLPRGPGFDPAQLRGPVLGHFGEQDPSVTPQAAAAFFAEFRARGREAEMHVYPGTGHAFFNEDRADSYQAEAAQLAWERTLAFLDLNLRSI